jgi:hypothetical protein
MNLFRSSRHTLSVVVTVLAAGVTVGCSTPAGPEAPAASTEASPPQTAAPSTEPTGPEIPRTGDHAVAISIPELPVGGNSVPDGAERQCATASWLQPAVLPGTGVKVTRIWIEPPDGFRVGGGCGGVRGCASFTFRPGGGQCSVAVTGRGTPEAQLKFKGEFTCAPGRESSCRELPARVNPGLVPLTQPEGTSAPESSATEPPPSSTG